MQRASDNKLDTAIQQVFEINQQAAWKPRSCWANDIDQEVDIAFRAGIALAMEPKTRMFPAPCFAAIT